MLEELEEQFIERQQVITEDRKARRDDADFAGQMRELYDQEERLRTSGFPWHRPPGQVYEGSNLLWPGIAGLIGFSP